MSARSLIDETEFQSQPSVDVSAEMGGSGPIEDEASRVLVDTARDQGLEADVRLSALHVIAYSGGHSAHAKTLVEELMRDGDAKVRVGAAQIVMASRNRPSFMGGPW